ncbi:SNF2 helicase associated domain-containing protein [Emergencia timonensis]|uniref:DEAD/DEAH box helicase n=1 Tax=Emergencia timonensis TaxID=1776384 RepID=UPI00399277C4
MITDSFIRALTIDKTYRKGMQIFLEKDRILEFNTEADEKNPDRKHIDALVRGSDRRYYDVSLTYNERTDQLEEEFCECPAFSNYDGICKHCVAVLREYMNHQQGTTRLASKVRQTSWDGSRSNFAVHKPQTTYAIKNLLNMQIQKKTAPILQKDAFGRVRLLPSFKVNRENLETKIQVSFKIGIDHMYVLKDVSEFAENMEAAANFAYGKRLQFIHSVESFDRESQPLAEFLVKWVKDWEKKEQGNSVLYYTRTIPKVRELSISGAELETLLDIMGEDTFELELSDSVVREWRVSEKIPEMDLYITGKEGGIEVATDANPLVRGREHYLYFAEGEIFKVPIKDVKAIDRLLFCMERKVNNPFFVAEDDIPIFCRELYPTLKQQFLCHIENFVEEDYGIAEAEFKIYLDAPEKNVVTGKIEAVYGDKKYNVYDRQTDYESRDFVKEIETAAQIVPYFERIDESRQELVISKDEDTLYSLLTEGIDEIQQLGQVYVSESLKRVNIRSTPTVSIGISLSGDLLELSLTAGDISREDLIDILGRYNKKKKFYRLKNGDFVQIEDDGITTLAELREGLNLTAKQLRQETVLLPKYRALYLDSELQAKTSLSVDRSRDFRALIRDMKTVDDNDFEVPATLSKTLREYQKKGFLWLKTLAHNGFGGILADDMGLGKTLQIIAYLLSEQEEKGTADGRPSLIVCPASLVYNWESEIHRFAPALKTRLIIGTAAGRQTLIEAIEAGEVCITSYELLKRDIKIYQEVAFGCQVIDEAQYIKNHNTQAAKSVKSIHAGFRVALTGTPVENRLSELWSIFDFLMPGFLHSYDRFRKEMENPIIQGQDEEAMERLRKMTHPFILRRLKKDVLKDLPDKIEKNMFTRMDGEQQKLYDAHVKQLQMFLDGASDEELSMSKIQILSQLTRLRQICCDPALVYENYQGVSAKTQMCIELISNAVSAGHKILLFSQFTTMLSDLEGRLEQEGISYYILTGATSKEKRSRMVKAFNEDDTSVFLISLKAGGTGLNLTAADMVIHFDPWWNLAVQNQATDRAHRIGQKNVVTVYKLIAQDTIEDKILELQERKKDLADQILTGRAMESVDFNREELMDLLRKS